MSSSRAIADSSSFWKDVREHQLLTDDQLERCLASIPENKREAEKIDNRLARIAIHFGYITLWQAQRILTRRAGTLLIDKYLLTDSLGQGGMGRVFLARDTRLQRSVALKVLNADKSNHERALARFQREALVGGQLQHENLVRVYDVGVHQNSPFLVMEYIEGPTVAELIARQGRLEIAVAARIGRDVALGLHHLSEKKLVHRDVNPRNILIDTEGRAKLTDLGLAIFEEQLSQVTTEGSTVGTFDYISPEQARHSRGVDIRSDLYSLGCSLYHMISGHPPFPEGNLAEKIYAHQLKEAEPLADLVPGVPSELSSMVTRCLRKKPEERFTTARELADKLTRYVTDESLLTTIDLNRSVTIETIAVTPQSISHPDNRASQPANAKSGAAISDGNDGKPGATKRQPEDSFQLNLGFDSLELPRRSENSRSKSIDSAIPAFRRRRNFGTVLVALLAGLAIMIAIRSLINHDSQTRPVERPQATVEHEPKAASKIPEITKPESVEALAPSIHVKYQDGQVRTFATIDEAIRNSTGQTAEITIPYRETPWIWNVSDARPIAGSHWLVQGLGPVRPVIHLELSDARSGLLVRADSVLELAGLMLEPKGATSSRPMISAFGQFEARDVWWRNTQGTLSPKSAILAGTRKLILKSCWFSNFPVAIDANILPDSKIDMERCLINYEASLPMKAAGSGINGVALRLEFPKWNVDKSSLSIDRCMFVGNTSIVLGGPNVDPAISISSNRSVFLAEYLFAFESQFGGESLRPRWIGTKDLYGRGIVFWPKTSKAPSADDLTSWKNFVSETESSVKRFEVPKSLSNSATPGELISEIDPGTAYGPFSDDRE